MGQWYKEHYYKVNISELDKEAAEKFADAVVSIREEDNHTFNSYGYKYGRRKEDVYRGKLSEQAFAIFLKEVFNYEFIVNYDVYPGEHNVDEDDLHEKDFTFDVKSSNDTDNRGVDNCIRSFNFPVPIQQKRSPRDIIVSLVVDNAQQNWYIIAWIDAETYLSNCKIGFWKPEKTFWHKYPLSKGYKIKDLKIFFNEENQFLNDLKIFFGKENQFLKFAKVKTNDPELKKENLVCKKEHNFICYDCNNDKNKYYHRYQNLNQKGLCSYVPKADNIDVTKCKFYSTEEEAKQDGKKPCTECIGKKKNNTTNGN